MTLTELKEIVKRLPDPEHVASYEIHVPTTPEPPVYLPCDNMNVPMPDLRIAIFVKEYEEIRNGFHKWYLVYKDPVVIK